MELTNSAGVPSLLLRSVIDDTRMASALIARITYDISPRGTLVRSAEQPWIVSRPPWEGPAGPMPSDEVFYRGGVDLMFFGEAWTPNGRPATASQFRVSVGSDFDYTVSVVGDRVWTAGNGRGPVPSSPRSFTSMPLTLAHAYGGKVKWDGLDIPFPSNPDGKGYCFDAKQAVGTPLPNLEDPRKSIRVWNDSPDPVGVGVCPAAFGPRVRESVVFHEGGELKELKPTFFNHAFPRLIAPRVRPGDMMVIQGGAPDGPLTFMIPRPSLTMALVIGGTHLVRPLTIDQIGVELPKRRAFVTYRYPFRYTITPRQQRSCVLRWDEGVS